MYLHYSVHEILAVLAVNLVHDSYFNNVLRNNSEIIIIIRVNLQKEYNGRVERYWNFTIALNLFSIIGNKHFPRTHSTLNTNNFKYGYLKK